MGKRRGNTIISPSPGYSSHSVSVRKIENGFLRSESGHGADGYFTRDTFHKEDPGLGFASEAPKVSGETLKGAVAHLKGLKK